MKEWIVIVRGRPVEEVKEDLRVTTRNAREDLKCWVRWTARAYFAAHNKDTAIGQNKCGLIPTSTLYGELNEH
jgi:hypothetical protein